MRKCGHPSTEVVAPLTREGVRSATCPTNGMLAATAARRQQIEPFYDRC